MGDFPLEERRALGDQMRRAADSVYANIAEGHARRATRDQLRFYDDAWASLVELQAHADQAIARTLIIGDTARDVRHRTYSVARLLTGLLEATRKRSSE